MAYRRTISNLNAAACKLDVWSPVEIAVAVPTKNQDSFDICLEQHDVGQIILPLAEFWATMERLAAEEMERTKPFRLMALPAELREKIYIMALPKHTTRVLSVEGLKRRWTRLPKLVFAQISRQTRKEAQAAYFAACTLSMRVSRHGDLSGHDWVRDQCPEALSSIRTLSLWHWSENDHGEEHHHTAIFVDLPARNVTLMRHLDSYGVCSECEEAEVVEGVLAKLQEFVDAMELVDGRKRLTPHSLLAMIDITTQLCLSQSSMDCLLAQKQQKEVADPKK